jgi:hypothetical protein
MVYQSMASPDYPGARQECLAGTSDTAVQLQVLAKEQTEHECSSGTYDYWQVQYLVGERQDGVPSFDCVLNGQAYCHVNDPPAFRP